MTRRLVGLWARTLVALYPPGFRAAVGRDLLLLLTDRAREARRLGPVRLIRYLAVETAICVRDAAWEWGAALAHGMKTWRGGERMGTELWLHDVRLAVRGLLRHPGYSLPALLTLTLGVGAGTAMFGVLEGVVLAPLPYPEPDELVQVSLADPVQGTRTTFSLPDVEDVEEQSRTLEHFGAYTTLPSDLILSGGDEAVEVETAYVTPGFLPALGTEPLHGRVFRPEDDRGDNRVVVVSHAFWRQHFGADPGAVGRTLELSGEPYRLIGVLPPEMTFPDRRVEAWVLLSVIPASSIPLHVRGVNLLRAVGRLAPGVTAARAEEELSGIAAELARLYPDSNERAPGAVVRPLRESMVGDVRGALRLLMAAGVVILLIMCANLANLALVREARRAPEVAVRSALGASRARRAGLVLTESLVLSLVGGGLGLLLAHGSTGLLLARSAGTLPRAQEVGVDLGVALFALGVSVLTGLIFGLLPGLQAAGSGLSTRIGTAGRATTRAGGRAVLVASQAALAVLLLVGAGLLVRSLHALGRVDPGFEPEGLVVADITFPSRWYPGRADYLARYDETLEAFRRIPGVVSVGSIRRFPLRFEGEALEWSVPGDPEEQPEGRILQVSPNVFETLGTSFTEGRTFAEDAGRDGRPVVVVNRSLATAAFGGVPAVGRFLDVGLDEPLEIVGVVEDVRHGNLSAPPHPTLYIPQYLSPRRGAAFVLRVAGGPEGAMASVRDIVRSLDPNQPITELTLATEIVGGELARPGFFTLLLGIFAGLALALCAVGVYGVVSFGASRRRREMGIRLAVGAEARDVVAEVVRGGMVPVALGILLGGAGSVAAVRAMESLVYGVGLYDPVAYIGAVLVIGLVGLAACYLPARRAAGTSPVEVLTAE